MMPDRQDPPRIADDAEKEMVGKATQVDAAEIMLADGKRLGSCRRLHHEAPVRFPGKGLAGFLQKPFTIDQLRTMLRGVLG